VVPLKFRKDVKLTTMGGRLFKATATRSLKKFLRTLSLIYALIYDNFIRITTYLGIFRAFQDPLTQNDPIRRGNTYGEGRVSRVSHAIAMHLHKCVARFVSDS